MREKTHPNLPFLLKKLSLPDSIKNRGQISTKLVSLFIGLVVVLLVVVISFVIILPRFRGASADKVTLIYWGLWEDKDVFSSLISDFQRQHPNITIQYEKQDIKKLGKYIERLRTRIDKGTDAPDVYRFHNSWLIQLQSHLLPFPSDVVASSEIDKRYYPVIKKDLNRNGAYYGIPLGIDTLALFVNNKIFQSGASQVPANWNDFLNVALHLTVKGSDNSIQTAGAGIGTFDNVAHATDIVSLLMVQNGGYVEEARKPRPFGARLAGLSDSQKKSLHQALSYYTFFAKKGEENPVIWDETQPNSQLAFVEGKTAMYFGYSWDIAEIKSLTPDLDFSIYPVPAIAGGRKDTIASYWVEGVSSNTKHPREAFEFLKFLSQRANLEKLHAEQAKIRRFGTPYARTDMADLLSSDQFLAPFVAQANNAVSTLFSSDTYDDGLNTVLNAYMGNTVRSIVKDNNSPESATDTLTTGVSQNVQKYEQ